MPEEAIAGEARIAPLRELANRIMRLLNEPRYGAELTARAKWLVIHLALAGEASGRDEPLRRHLHQITASSGLSPHEARLSRDQAMAAGWLEFKRAHNRQAGLYRVTVPPEVEGDFPRAGGASSLASV